MVLRGTRPEPQYEEDGRGYPNESSLFGGLSLMEQFLTYLSQPVATLLAGVLAAAVTVVLGYMLGRRQTVHDRLYEERAKVVATLFKRFETVQRDFALLVSPIDVGDISKKERAAVAVESFNELQAYYRSNSIWLSRGTSKRVDSFIYKYRKTFADFQESFETEDSTFPNRQQWSNIWKRFEQEAPDVRKRLEVEFRAVLGYRVARLYHLWLNTRLLLRGRRRSRDGSQE